MEESQSDSLRDYLGQGLQVVTCEIAITEMGRLINRLADGDGELQSQLLSSWDGIRDAIIITPLTSEMLESAAVLPVVNLGTLDAIHIASALNYTPSVISFVTYDKRQAEAAAELGLAEISP